MTPSPSPRAIAIAASLVIGVGLTPRDAHAFCRTRVSPNVIDDCSSKGPSLFWTNRCVGYTVAKAASKKADLATARNLVANAMNAWTQKNSLCSPGIAAMEQAPTDDDIVGADRSGAINKNIVVFRDDTWPYDKTGSPLGLTTVTFNQGTGEIFDADIEINTADRDVTAKEPLPASGYDLQSIITHEVGHYFGLAHSHTDGATMEPRYDHGQIGLRTLETDDMRGICTIYPSPSTRTTDLPGQATPTNITAGPCEPNIAVPLQEPPEEKKGCSCAATPPGGGEVGFFAVASAVFMAVRRRRQRP